MSQSSTLFSAVASQHGNPGFESSIYPFCMEFSCSPCVCVGCLQVLQLPNKQLLGLGLLVIPSHLNRLLSVRLYYIC